MGHQFVNGTVRASWDAEAFELIAGNAVIVFLSSYGGGPSTGVVDSAGNLYTRFGPTDGGDGTHKMECWIAVDCIGHAANLVSALGDGVSFKQIGVVQYSGLDPADVFAAMSAASVSASGTVHATAAVVAPNPDALVLGFYVAWVSGAGTFSESDGCTIRTNNAGAAAVVQRPTTAAGSYATSIASSISDQYASIAVALNVLADAPVDTGLTPLPGTDEFIIWRNRRRNLFLRRGR